jgi:hypothetical protein
VSNPRGGDRGRWDIELEFVANIGMVGASCTELI